MGNPGFETPGVGPGEAQDWLSGTTGGAENVALFDGEPAESFESGWGEPGAAPSYYGTGGDNSTSKTIFGLSDVAYALFEGLSLDYEGFDYSYYEPAIGVPGNHFSLLTFGDADILWAGFTGGDLYDDFTAGWNTATKVSFDPADVSYQDFDAAPESFEDFEEGHNQSAATPGWAWSTAMFDAGVNDSESFETWTTQLVW